MENPWRSYTKFHKSEGLDEKKLIILIAIQGANPTFSNIHKLVN